MSLSDLASLGSFVSGLAVLASLAFLYFQMRQMTEQVRQAERNQRALMQQGRSTRSITTNLTLAQPAITGIFYRGLNGDETLTAVELLSFIQLISAMLINYEDSFLQHRAGTLSAESLASDMGSVIVAYGPAPGFQAAWEIMKLALSTPFREYLDDLLKQATVTGFGPDLRDIWKASLRNQAVAAEARA